MAKKSTNQDESKKTSKTRSTSKSTSTSKNMGSGKKTSSAPPPENNEKTSNLKKIFLIAGIFVLISIIGLAFLMIGKQEIPDSSMESSYFKGRTLFYNRWSSIERGDVVFFHHPEYDSIAPSVPDKNYYYMCRKYGNRWINKSEVVFNPIEKRQICLSRVIGVAGDNIEIKNNQLFVNKQIIKEKKSDKRAYFVEKEGLLNPQLLDSLGITKEDLACQNDYSDQYTNLYGKKQGMNNSVAIYALNEQNAGKLATFPIIKKVIPLVAPEKFFESTIYPYDKNMAWNESNFGPVVVPIKGRSIKLNPQTIKLYGRIIEAYENNKVSYNNGMYFVNDKIAETYTFEQDYYFVISDNRSSNNDSRYFGFLPKDHIIGVKL